MKPAKILKNPMFWYAILFLIFILFRLFVAQPAYFISGDEAKFLKGALTLPEYHQWNNQLDLYNPPGLSYMFAISQIFFSDLRGPQLVELAFAILFFIYVIKLFRLFKKSDAWIWIAVLFLAIAHEMIMMSFRLYKEGVYVTLFVMMLYYFLRALRGENKHYVTTTIIGAINAYTTDHIFLFLPLLFLMFLMFRTEKTHIWKALACLAIIGIVFASWMGTRLWVYETNDWYPAGVDGTPEYVKDYGFMNLLSPSGFANTAEMIGNKIHPRPAHMASYLAYMLNIEPALIDPNLTYSTAKDLLAPAPIIFMILIYLPLAAIVLFGFWNSRKHLIPKKMRWNFIKENQHLFFAIMYIVLNVFMIYKGFSNRYSYAAAIPLVFFLVEGIGGISKLTEIKLATIAKWLAAFALIVLVPLHLITHPTFALFMPFEVDAQNTAEFLNSLPGDGIMVQAGYTPEIMWLTHPKRVLSLPRTSENFEQLLEKYDISYVVYGERYWAKPIPENKDNVWDYETIEYIRNHPYLFKKIKTITETYETHPADTLHVYSVV